MKKISFLSIIFFVVLTHAQNIPLKITIQTEDNKCQSDFTTKRIVIRNVGVPISKQVKTLSSQSCENELLIPRKNGKYQLKVSADAYMADSLNFEITANSTEIKLPDIQLRIRKKEVNLNEVTVVGNKQEYIKVDADKTTYFVKGNQALTSGSMEDALKKIPGVIKSASGDLTFNGRNLTVYLDGVPANLSGEDLKAFLQGLPANSIDKIELIENPGAYFEANTNGSVINIVTRSVALNSFNGTLNLHYGNSEGQDKYSPSLMMNGKVKKVNWQLQTGYNSHEVAIQTKTDLTYNDNNDKLKGLVFTHDGTSYQLNNNFYFRPMVNFRLSPRSNLIFNYNLNVADNTTNDSTNNFTRNLPTSSQLDYYSLYTNKNHNTNHEVVGKFKTQLDSAGGKNLQITGYLSNFTRNGSANSSMPQIPNYGINSIDLNLTNTYLKYDVDLKFKPLQINTGGKFSKVFAHNFGQYNLLNLTSGIFTNRQYVDVLTKDFKYDETNFALYLEARKKFGKLSTTLGVRMEDLLYSGKVATGSRAYGDTLLNVFPTVNLMYEFNTILNLRGQYSRKISVPSFNTLDPNSSGYFDQYTGTVGNQNLKPNFYDNYNLSLSAFNFVSLRASYSFTKSVSLLTSQSFKDSLYSNQTYKTYENIGNFNASLSFPIPFDLITKGPDFFKKPMDFNNMSYLFFYVGYNLQNIAGYVYSDGSKNAQPFWVLYASTHINMPWKLKLDAQYQMIPRGHFQIYTLERPIQFFLVDVSRSFLKNNSLTFTAEVNKSYPLQLSFPTQYTRTDFFNAYDGLTFWFKLSYRFGKFKSKEETEINIEKKQIEGEGVNIK
jgi:iron complex outermembrane recepter protein